MTDALALAYTCLYNTYKCTYMHVQPRNTLLASLLGSTPSQKHPWAHSSKVLWYHVDKHVMKRRGAHLASAEVYIVGVAEIRMNFNLRTRPIASQSPYASQFHTMPSQSKTHVHHAISDFTCGRPRTVHLWLNDHPLRMKTNVSHAKTSFPFHSLHVTCI